MSWDATEQWLVSLPLAVQVLIAAVTIVPVAVVLAIVVMRGVYTLAGWWDHTSPSRRPAGRSGEGVRGADGLSKP